MTIEEKARAYDEALEVAKRNLEAIEECGEGTSFAYDGFRNTLIHIFPQLEESGDEKIRKEIISFLLKMQGREKNTYNDGQYESWISYLEKQGEQKQEWSLQDEKNLDDIFCAIRLDNALSDKKQDRLIWWLQQYHPYMHKEQKPVEWSEEDESMRTRCIGILGKCYMGELPTKVEEELNWLKSLNPQSQWKPSKEQIKVLEFFIPYVTKCNVVLQKSKDTLLSLLSDLKKLREE